MTPIWAAKVWAEADRLYIEFPGKRSHTVELPNNPVGLAEALKIINARRIETRLCDAGEPTQFQVAKALSAKAQKIVRLHPKNRLSLTLPQAEAAKAALREVGLL